MRLAPLLMALSLSAAAQFAPSGQAPATGPRPQTRNAAPEAPRPTPKPETNPKGPQAAATFLKTGLRPVSIALIRPNGGLIGLKGQIPASFRTEPGREANAMSMLPPAAIAPLDLTFFLVVDSDATTSDSQSIVQRKGRYKIVRSSFPVDRAGTYTGIRVTRPGLLISFGPQVTCGASWKRASLSQATEAQLADRAAEICMSFTHHRP